MNGYLVQISSGAAHSDFKSARTSVLILMKSDFVLEAKVIYSCTGICTTKQPGCPLIVNVHIFAVRCSSFLFKANCISISPQVCESYLNWLCISGQSLPLCKIGYHLPTCSI